MVRNTLFSKAILSAVIVFAATTAFPSAAKPQAGAATSAAAADASPPYRNHVANMIANENWYEIERRGYKAQRARPTFEVKKADDIPIYERRDLDRRGRMAQRSRGARLSTRNATYAARMAAPNQYPGFARFNAGQTNRGLQLPPRMQAGTGRRLAGKALGLANKASNLDLGAQVIGGRDIGVTRFASDMTVGQVSNAFDGGDPIASAINSSKRFGHNFERGVAGVGQSIRDPRRIPGNAVRALEGTRRAAVGATQYVGETAVRVARDSTRMVSDPGFAKKQVNKAGKTVRNVGKSVCKGLSYFIPGAKKKKCK